MFKRKNKTIEDKNKIEEKKKKDIAQEWVGINDIKNGVVYFENGSILKAIRVWPKPITLMTDKEQNELIIKLARRINSIAGDWEEKSTYKNVDMQTYIKNAEKKAKTEQDEIKKRILREKIKFATEVSMLDDYSDILYYVTAFEKKNDNKSLAKLNEKASKIAQVYSSVKMQTEVLGDEDLEFMYKLYNRKSNILYEDKLTKTQGNISFIPANFDDEFKDMYSEGE